MIPLRNDGGHSTDWAPHRMRDVSGLIGTIMKDEWQSDGSDRSERHDCEVKVHDNMVGAKGKDNSKRRNKRRWRTTIEEAKAAPRQALKCRTCSGLRRREKKDSTCDACVR